jgi:hypothetical protein
MVTPICEFPQEAAETNKGNHISMKQVQLLPLLAVVALAGTANAAAPVACDGAVQLTNQSNVQVRQVGFQTFVEFDFTGLHDICLGNGSEVTGVVTGHLVQRISTNGDFTLRFNEILSYGGGTLGYRGEASQSNGHFQSHVVTVGAGTGRSPEFTAKERSHSQARHPSQTLSITSTRPDRAAAG